MTVTVTSALAGPATARYSNVYGALVDLGVLSGLGAQDVTGSGDPVAPILNASQFYAPLTHSLILTRGTGDPTFTRATSAWEFDNEGKLILVPSGAARFGGARMVGNIITYTEDLSNVIWSKYNNATVTGSNQVNLTADIDSRIVQNGIAASSPYGNSCLFSVLLSGSGQCYIGVFDDSAPWPTTFSGVITLTATPTRYSLLRTNQTVAATRMGAIISVRSLGTPATVIVQEPQLENVTGQADQTASEYVSAGVLSAPFHGAGVDGVKWFDTNKDGSAISESSLLGNHAEGASMNSLLSSRQLFGYWRQAETVGSEKVSNGQFGTDTTGWTGWSGTTSLSAPAGKLLLTNIAGASAVQLAVTPIATTIGKTYTYVVGTATKGNKHNQFLLTASNTSTGGSAHTAISFGTVNTIETITNLNMTFVATATTTYVSVRCDTTGTATGGEVSEWDDISVKEAAIQVTTCTGIDNAANSASTITAGAADATILQTLSLAAAARSFSAYVKRRTGTGSVYITRDGGTNWTDITSSLGASWTRVKIENTSVLNPSVGFKIATSGDAIDVDVCQDEAGAFITSPIITTTAAVTRNKDALSYQSAGNFSNSDGTALGTVYPAGVFINNDPLFRFTGGEGLYSQASNKGAFIYDGVTFVNAPAGSPSTPNKIAGSWTGAVMRVCANASAVSSGAYDGSFGSSAIFIGGAVTAYRKNIYIWQSALTDAQLQQVTA